MELLSLYNDFIMKYECTQRKSLKIWNNKSYKNTIIYIDPMYIAFHVAFLKFNLERINNSLFSILNEHYYK